MLERFLKDLKYICLDFFTRCKISKFFNNFLRKIIDRFFFKYNYIKFLKKNCL